MTEALNALAAHIREIGGTAIVRETVALHELTLDVRADMLRKLCLRLRDDNRLRFEQLIDVCGVDYFSYRAEAPENVAGHMAPAGRFAAVYHLLSVSRNQRLRLRVFAADDGMPRVDSVVDIWPSANWFEREAFDLFGIVFEGHPDLRRILTDYGFIGHPFRKDFPLSGHVEMRYDPVQRRVIYQPVTIDPRNNNPRVIREEGYGARNP